MCMYILTINGYTTDVYPWLTSAVCVECKWSLVLLENSQLVSKQVSKPVSPRICHLTWEIKAWCWELKSPVFCPPGHVNNSGILKKSGLIYAFVFPIYIIYKWTDFVDTSLTKIKQLWVAHRSPCWCKHSCDHWRSHVHLLVISEINFPNVPKSNFPCKGEVDKLDVFLWFLLFIIK